MLHHHSGNSIRRKRFDDFSARNLIWRSEKKDFGEEDTKKEGIFGELGHHKHGKKHSIAWSWRTFMVISWIEYIFQHQKPVWMDRMVWFEGGFKGGKRCALGTLIRHTKGCIQNIHNDNTGEGGRQAENMWDGHRD